MEQPRQRPGVAWFQLVGQKLHQKGLVVLGDAIVSGGLVGRMHDGIGGAVA